MTSLCWSQVQSLGRQSCQKENRELIVGGSSAAGGSGGVEGSV